MEQAGRAPPDEWRVGLLLPQLAQSAPGVGVVLTQHPPAADQSVLAELASRLVLPQLPQAKGEDVARAQDVGVVLARYRAMQIPGAFEQWLGGGELTPAQHILGGAIEQPGNILLDPGENAI